MAVNPVETGRREIQTDPQVIESVEAWKDTWHSPGSGPLFSESRALASWMPGDVKGAAYPEMRARDDVVNRMAITMVLAISRGDHAETGQIIFDSLRAVLSPSMFEDLGSGLLKDAWIKTAELMREQQLG